MRYQRTTDAASEPISVAEAKEHLKVDTTADDTYIGTLITAARQYCENYTERSFITQTWRLFLEDFSYDIKIEKPELISVTTVEYRDSDGNLATVDSSDYSVTGNIVRAIDSWPVSNNDYAESVVVTFTAGYGASESDVPEAINQAIKIMVGHWYEIRQEVVMGSVPRKTPFAAHALLDQYKNR